VFGTERRRNDVLQISSNLELSKESEQPSYDVPDARYQDLSTPISLYEVMPPSFQVKFKNLFEGSKSPFGENRLNHLIRLKKRNKVTH
jgi:hypothetical protein